MEWNFTKQWKQLKIDDQHKQFGKNTETAVAEYNSKKDFLPENKETTQ